MSLRKRAQRMSPNQRREQIMDSAVALIVSRGLSSCTLELVAVEARISKPLIYRYFPKLANLFKALVEREYRFLRGRGLDVLPKNAAYEEVIHRSNLRTMEYLYERGPIMRLDYFAKRCVEEYGVPQEVARVCSIMTVNAPILSVRALRSSGIAAHRAAEIWSDFVIGGNYALRLKYGKPKQVKPRKRRKPLS
jgi:AcrR family transcriptional regulator